MDRAQFLRLMLGGAAMALLPRGVRAARATWVATLDGDGQNDPADIPSLVTAQAGAGEAANAWRR